MPRFDLRHDDGTLDPLAPFKVLTVMCHPNDRLQREKMLGNILKETEEGQPRRRPLASEEFIAEVRRTDKRGAIAGGLLLAMIQLESNGLRPSLNQAIPLVAALLPRWIQPQGPDWSTECHIDHHPRHRAKLLKAYNEYRSVAHLWGALLHGLQHDRQDIWPGSIRTLATFIAYAEAILDRACRLPTFARGHRFAMSPNEAWRFTIPSLRRLTLRGSPFAAKQLAILNERATRTALK